MITNHGFRLGGVNCLFYAVSDQMSVEVVARMNVVSAPVVQDHRRLAMALRMELEGEDIAAWVDGLVI